VHLRIEIGLVYADLAEVCLKHNVYWIKRLISRYLRSRHLPLKVLIWFVVKGVEFGMREK